MGIRKNNQEKQMATTPAPADVPLYKNAQYAAYMLLRLAGKEDIGHEDITTIFEAVHLPVTIDTTMSMIGLTESFRSVEKKVFDEILDTTAKKYKLVDPKASSAPVHDVTGDWRIYVPERNQSYGLTLKQDKSGVVTGHGSTGSPRNLTYKVTGFVRGDTIEYEENWGVGGTDKIVAKLDKSGDKFSCKTINASVDAARVTSIKKESPEDAKYYAAYM